MNNLYAFMKAIILRFLMPASFTLVLALKGILLSAQPVISSISALNGIPGTTINITGSGFNTTAANNKVYFGATKAAVTVASASALTVTVPAGATFKPVTVNNAASALTGYSQYPFFAHF